MTDIIQFYAMVSFYIYPRISSLAAAALTWRIICAKWEMCIILPHGYEKSMFIWPKMPLNWRWFEIKRIPPQKYFGFDKRGGGVCG